MASTGLYYGVVPNKSERMLSDTDVIFDQPYLRPLHFSESDEARQNPGLRSTAKIRVGTFHFCTAPIVTSSAQDTTH